MLNLKNTSDLAEDLENKKDSPVDQAMTVFTKMIADRLEEEQWGRGDD